MEEEDGAARLLANVAASTSKVIGNHHAQVQTGNTALVLMIVGKMEALVIVTKVPEGATIAVEGAVGVEILTTVFLRILIAAAVVVGVLVRVHVIEDPSVSLVNGAEMVVPGQTVVEGMVEIEAIMILSLVNGGMVHEALQVHLLQNGQAHGKKKTTSTSKMMKSRATT